MQIIVLGMHRAGTSLTARLLNMMGAYFGPEGLSLGFSKDNPKGFWERRDVLAINRNILHYCDSSWYKVDRVSAEKLANIPKELTRAIRNTVLELDANRPWMIKDPRLCLTLPCWLPWLEVPVVVVATREPMEIAQSLFLRNGIPLEYGLSLWEHHAVHAIRNAYDLPKIFISFEAMLSEPVKNMQLLHDKLIVHGVQGLRMPSEREILAFVQPSLQRARKADIPDMLTEDQRTLAAILCGEAMKDADVKVSDRAKRLMETTGGQISGAPLDH